MPEEINKFTDLVTKTISRLAKIWEAGEGDLNIEIRDDKGIKKAKIMGGETERV